MTILALHGFLGNPEDWPFGEPVAGASSSALKDQDILRPDLAVWATLPDAVDLMTTAKAINEQLRQRTDHAVIAGYSLGARIAAHCVLDDPKLYRGALLISFHPGLNHGDREARIQNDSEWSKKLRDESWEKTMEAWNNQAVLKPGTRVKSQPPAAPKDNRRSEGRRQIWARAIETWSLGKQADLREGLSLWAQENSLTVMTGTDDAKFTELTADWHRKMPHFRHRTVLGAGHRILQEAPDDVISELSALVAGK